MVMTEVGSSIEEVLILAPPMLFKAPYPRSEPAVTSKGLSLTASSLGLASPFDADCARSPNGRRSEMRMKGGTGWWRMLVFMGL